MISVVIPTHNRAPKLAELLETLCCQTLPVNRFEVIVVDNGSTDDTPAVVERFAGRLNVRCVYESRVGSSLARNRGWVEAVGRMVAFTDDDCHVASNWLELATEIIEEKSPAVFGGPYYPLFDPPAPRWYRPEYATHDRGPVARPLDAHEALTGANMFCRRDVLKRLGGFDVGKGRVGRRRGHGADTDLVLRARRMMPDELLYYHPGLIVHHRTGHERFSVAGRLVKTFSQTGVGFSIAADGGSRRMSFRRAMRISGKVLWLAFKIALEPLRCVVDRDRSAYPAWQNYFSEHTCFYVYQLRAYVEQLRRWQYPIRAMPGLPDEGN